MRKIIPTIFARNKKEFNQRFEKLIELNADLHVDFMDGHFVRARGIKTSDVPNLIKNKIKFEAHLMSLNPEEYIDRLKAKGFDKIIFHYEAINRSQILKLIDKIKANKMQVWIAINPSTKINRILEFLNKLDGVLFMGVFPGKEHKKFVNKVYEKIMKLKKINKKIKIQVDGGVNIKIAQILGKLGVNYANSGSFISDSKNPREALWELEKAFD